MGKVRQQWRFVLMLIAFGWHMPSVALTADEILIQSRDRPDGDDVYSDVKLIMTDEDGRTRMRDMIYLQRDYGRDERLTLYFTGPTDVRGVAFQSVNYDETGGREDDQWLYLPAFRQIRRIATADKRGAFMGSEFRFVDMERLRVTDYTQTLIGEEKIDGRNAYVIERKPSSDAVINKTGYYRTVVWVDRESHVVLKQTYYDIKGVLFKALVVKKLEKVQGIWTVMQTDMQDLITKKSSSLVFSNVKYNVGLDDDMFKPTVLKTGVSLEKLSKLR